MIYVNIINILIDFWWCDSCKGYHGLHFVPWTGKILKQKTKRTDIIDCGAQMGLMPNISYMVLKIWFWSTFGATCHNNGAIGRISGHPEQYLERKIGKIVSSTRNCLEICMIVEIVFYAGDGYRGPYGGWDPILPIWGLKVTFDVGFGPCGTITSVRATLSGISNERYVEWLASR